MIAGRRQMQREARQHIRRAVDQNRHPKRVRDFGFIQPWRKALEYGDLYAMTNGTSMPRPGGWDAQSEAYKQDIFIYMKIRAYEAWKFAEKYQAEQQQDSAPEYEPLDWQDYT